MGVVLIRDADPWFVHRLNWVNFATRLARWHCAGDWPN